jgi:hypothetical protein
LSERRKKMKLTTRYGMILISAVMLLAVLAGPVGAHPHVVSNPDHDQVLANGQNHPGFSPTDATGLRNSCEGVLEPANSGAAGYGLETAHHGPDAGDPGKADGCYATQGDPQDNNPAID